jgi:hypothetical protein
VQLYELAQPNESQAVFLDVPGGTDQLVEPDDLFDLTQPGVERFITAPTPIRNPSPERAQCRTYDLPEYHLDAYIASPRSAPSGLAVLN